MTESIQPKPVLLKFEWRRTGMGGVSDTVLISFRTNKPITSRLHRGNTHGVRTYAVYPAKYLLYNAERSNRGNVHITVKVVEVHADGNVTDLQTWTLYDGKEPTDAVYKLPNNIKQLLLANASELPLFDYVEEYLKGEAEE